MLRLLFSFLCLIYAFDSSACSYAYQYSLYPLGMSGGRLVVLEVEMERYVNHPDFKFGGGGHQVFSADIESRWKGSLRLCYQDKNKLELIEVISRKIDIGDATYEQELEPSFMDAYNKAAELPFFEVATLQQVGTCHYDITCPFFQKKVLVDEAQGYCYTTEHPDVFYKIEVPLGILKKFEQMTNDTFSDLSKLAPEVRSDFYKLWKPYAVRHYTIGTQSFVAFTLGWGQKLPTPILSETKWNTNLPPIEQYVEGKEVLLHGYRFDFIHEL